MVISDNHSEESLRNYISRPSSEQQRACSILSDALSGWPHQSQQPSLTALSSQAIFVFLYIRLSFLHKTHVLSSLFSDCYVKKLAWHYEPQFSRISLNISLSDCLRLLFLPTSLVLWPLPACFTTKESTVKASLFVKYNSTDTFSRKSVRAAQGEAERNFNSRILKKYSST